MNLYVYLAVTAIQTGVLLAGAGKWAGKWEERVQGLRAELEEHKALPAMRAHG